MAWLVALAIAVVTGVVLLLIFVVTGLSPWVAVAGTGIGVVGGAVLLPVLFEGADRILSRLVQLRADDRRVRGAGRVLP